MVKIGLNTSVVTENTRHESLTYTSPNCYNSNCGNVTLVVVSANDSKTSELLCDGLVGAKSLLEDDYKTRVARNTKMLTANSRSE